LRGSVIGGAGVEVGILRSRPAEIGTRKHAPHQFVVYIAILRILVSCVPHNNRGYWMRDDLMVSEQTDDRKTPFDNLTSHFWRGGILNGE
jgi:hypothetical protein